MLRTRSRRPQSGFTLVELLIVVAIIGIIASIIVPNLMDSMKKGKQKRTMTDIRLVGTSWLSWLTDQSSAAAAGQQVVPGGRLLDWSEYENRSATQLENLLVPQYANFIPVVDAWGFPLEYGAAPSVNHRLPVAIRSSGADGEFSEGEYVAGGFPATAYEEDTVWAGGFFITWPTGGIAAEEPP